MENLKIKVVKRDGVKVDFDLNKIKNSINKASLSNELSEEVLNNLTRQVVQSIAVTEKKSIKVEVIQNIIIGILKFNNHHTIAESFEQYRNERTKVRETKSNLMETIKKIGVSTDRDNANIGNNFSAKLLRIASESNKWTQLAQMPHNLAKEHEVGNVYYHDLDSYNLTVNCLHIPTAEVLQKGFNTGYGQIKAPKRIETAGELSCILLQSTQNDCFGGQSHPDFDNDMALFIPYTINEIKEELEGYGLTGEVLEKAIDAKLRKRVSQTMQGVVFNLNSMNCRAGSQVPFSSINIGIPTREHSALICELFLKEYEKGLGKGEVPIFPNIIFRVKDGVNKKPSDPYYYLFELACRVSAKKMNPTFMNIDADFNKEYYDRGYLPSTMGCRTYLMKNINGEPGCKGRGNIAPVTINLPRIGILAQKNEEKFFEILEERLNLCVESLLHRYGVLKTLKLKDLPFVAGQRIFKGSENLDEMDSIEPILKQGTWGIGFIGLAETLVALTGEHHGQSNKAKELGVKIISFMRNFTDLKTNELKLNFATYATPAEGLSGKFIVQDKKMFGVIDGVTDKDYYTNSFHVPVGYPISITNKIDIESPYHKLCNGGHISYIEVDDYPSPEIIKSILDYAYTKTNINYIGINFHMRYCKDCGTYLRQECKCTNCNSMNIQGVSRVTGYLSLDERFTPGKSAEREDRISHTKNIKNYNL